MSNDQPPTLGTSSEQPNPTPTQDNTLTVSTLRYPPEPQDSSLKNLLYQALQSQLAEGDRSAVDKIIELEFERRSQELALQQAELSLREKEINNKHELALRAEERKNKADVSTKNNIRLIIATFTIAFLASLGYATFSRDSSLADKVFTGALGLLGGGGGVALLSKKSNEQEQDKP
ncbi:MAG: hypothetical protein HC769_29835 [Cyanobacteria bacterium CRU_2_1]|nr:hypothetical protein [Cyanobacteria bacterium CRU_2_1]